MKKLKTAVVGVAHPHVGTLYRSLLSTGEVEYIGWADTAARDRQMESNRKCFIQDGVPYWEDVNALCDADADAAIVCADNALAIDYACRLLERGIAVALEKPMAITYADAKRAADAAKKSGAKLAVNWPIAWFPAFNRAKELCDEGRAGDVMRVTYRSPATWGPFSYAPGGELPDREYLANTWWYDAASGGGSLLDYACYGTALATWFFGRRAERVWGVRRNFVSPGFDIEDFSAMMLDFGTGIGLLEGSWSTYNCGEVPSGPIIHGTKATIVCDRHSNLVKIYETRSHPHAKPTEVIECPKAIPGFDFGANFLAHLTKDAPLHPLLTPELNLSVTAALEAGRNDADRGTAVVK